MNKEMLDAYDGIVIPTLTAAETVQILRTFGISHSEETFADGVEQGVYPFGTCICTKANRRRIVVYKKLFDEWLLERAVENDSVRLKAH